MTGVQTCALPISISCIEYNDTSKKLILDYKYKSKTYLCEYIVQIMEEKYRLENLNVDYILYVPLHKNKYKQRGFNQSEKIAKRLGKNLNIPVLDLLERRKNTQSLYNLNKEERYKELKNGFVVKNNIEAIKNKKILLIDDIFTTGATCNEISKVLKLEGLNNICVLTLLTRTIDVYAKEGNYVDI